MKVRENLGKNIVFQIQCHFLPCRESALKIRKDKIIYFEKNNVLPKVIERF